LMGIFPSPFLQKMEKSVQRFATQQKLRAQEPDGPPHRYGSAPPKSADEIKKQIDDVAARAGAVNAAIPAAPKQPAGSAAPAPAPGGNP
jgi:hypothetical protein